MNPETQDIINIQMAKMPPAVRQAIARIDFPAQIRALSQANNLRTDQSGALEQELILVILGLENPDAFVNNLARNGNIPHDVAAKITADIDERILKPIRHELAEMREKDRLTEEILKTAQEESSVPPAVIMPQTPARAATPITPTVPATTAPAAPAAPVITPAAPTSTPAPAATENSVRTLSSDFAKERMERQLRMPTETKQVTDKPVSGGEEKKYPGVDPYREPTA